MLKVRLAGICKMLREYDVLAEWCIMLLNVECSEARLTSENFSMKNNKQLLTIIIFINISSCFNK